MTKSATFAVLTAAGILCATSGCSVVRSTEPMGTSPVSLVPEEWDGTWQAPGSSGFCVVKVTDAEAGKLDVAFTGIEDERIRMRTLHVQIRQSGDWTFFSVPAQEFANQGDEVKDGYFWGRIKKEGDRAVFWLPHFKRIEAAVAEGRLPGRKISDSEIVLNPLDESHYRFLTSGEKGVLLDWESPGVLIRIPR
ncbi:MAG: hypothetical protein GYA33_12950 [Thermogutta sp.]|nr:hypothetical protein [Thermogutta sp.]